MICRSLLVLGAIAVAGCQPGGATTYDVAMRDGVHLATDVYLPEGDGPFPTVLYRTPYSKEGDQYHAAALTAAGVAVVGQDLRGRFQSEGIDGVFTTDGDGPLKDGYDTMAWIVDQPWSDGVIGTRGDSALGITQYMAASAAPPGLAVIDAGFATPNVYSDVFLQGGVRRYALSHNWLEEQGSLHFEDDMAEHPYLDDFWDSVETNDQFGAVEAAGHHVGGWFDIFSQGTLDAFVGYQRAGGSGALGNQRLVMGPWTHTSPWALEQGELQFPPNAALPPVANGFDVMFNHWLGIDHPDIDASPADLPTVQYYVMGDVDDASAPGNEWRSADDWPPPAAPIRLHLQPGGGLAEACPPVDGGGTSYVADPEDPSPTLCGNNLTIPAGPCDQRPVESREDVRVFETGILSEPMEITGRMRAHLFVDIDQPDADLMVRLTDVYPDGRSMLVADGALRLATRASTSALTPVSAGEVVEGVVDLWSTALIVNRGHRLRISVTSSNWPRFSVNANNGLDYPESVEGQGSPVTVTVHHDGLTASYIELPDPSRSPSDVVTCGAR